MFFCDRLFEERVVEPFLADIAGDGVSWEHEVVVGEGEQFRLDLVDEQVVVAPGQVGSSDAQVEEGIAGEYCFLVVEYEAQTARAVSGAVSAFDREGGSVGAGRDVEQVAVVDETGVDVGQRRNGKAHDRGIGRCLFEEFFPVAMECGRQVVSFAKRFQPSNMVHVGVGDENQRRSEVVFVDKLSDLSVFVRCGGTWVDDGTRTAVGMIYDIAVDFVVVERELVYHGFLLGL